MQDKIILASTDEALFTQNPFYRTSFRVMPLPWWLVRWWKCWIISLVTWLSRGKMTGNFISSDKLACLRHPPTRKIPFKSKNRSSLYSELHVFRLAFFCRARTLLSGSHFRLAFLPWNVSTVPHLLFHTLHSPNHGPPALVLLDRGFECCVRNLSGILYTADKGQLLVLHDTSQRNAPLYLQDLRSLN